MKHFVWNLTTENEGRTLNSGETDGTENHNIMAPPLYKEHEFSQLKTIQNDSKK